MGRQFGLSQFSLKQYKDNVKLCKCIVRYSIAHDCGVVLIVLSDRVGLIQTTRIVASFTKASNQEFSGNEPESSGNTKEQKVEMLRPRLVVNQSESPAYLQNGLLFIVVLLVPHSSIHAMRFLKRYASSFWRSISSGRLLENRSQKMLTAVPRLALVIVTALTWFLAVSVVAGCLWMLSDGFQLLDVAAVFCLVFVGWAFFPRFESPPPVELCVEPREFPEIYAMVQRVARQFEVTMPKIVLTQQYRVGFGRFGWRAEPVLFLSHGLLSLTNLQETAILLSHELHHCKHGAWAHSRIVKTTANGLKRLIPLWRQNDNKLHLFQLPILPLMLFDWLLNWASACELRQLELEADAASLMFGRPEAMQTLLEKCASRHASSVQRIYAVAKPAQQYASIQATAAKIDRLVFNPILQSFEDERDEGVGTHPSMRTHPSTSERLLTAHKVSVVTQHSLITQPQFERVHEELSYWPVWLDHLEQSLISKGII